MSSLGDQLAAFVIGTGSDRKNGRLLIVQMQDAQINLATDIDSVTYGDGSTDRGAIAIGVAVNYEYVRATSAVGMRGGTLIFAGDGTGNRLVNSYATPAAGTGRSGTVTGAQRFQIVRVPQYRSLGLTGAITAIDWNGTTHESAARGRSGKRQRWRERRRGVVHNRCPRHLPGHRRIGGATIASGGQTELVLGGGGSSGEQRRYGPPGGGLASSGAAGSGARLIRADTVTGVGSLLATEALLGHSSDESSD